MAHGVLMSGPFPVTFHYGPSHAWANPQPTFPPPPAIICAMRCCLIASSSGSCEEGVPRGQPSSCAPLVV